MTAIAIGIGIGRGGKTTPPPANTVLPAITGTAELGATLTASTGTWSNSPSSYSYQWKRDGSSIGGATSSTYVLQSADLGTTITVTVTATNASGSSSATSAGTPIPAYLLLDRFTTNQAAPLTTPRACQPGPGNLVITDTANKLSIVGSQVVFSGKGVPSDGDPGFWSQSSFARLCGRAVLMDITITSGTRTIIGWDADQAGLISSGALWFATTFSMQTRGTQNINVPEVYAFSTAYTVACILRTTGFWVAIKGGAFTDWTLLNVEATMTSTPLFPGWGNLDDVGTLDNMRVVDLGAPWSTQDGPASTVIASPTNPQAFTMAAEALVEITWTPAAAEVFELDVRRTDANNRWIVRCDQAGSTIALIERNAGVETSRSSVAQTWTIAAAFRIVVSCTGNKIFTYVTGASKSVYAAAAFNNTATGGNAAGGATTANLKVWPKAITIPNS